MNATLNRFAAAIALFAAAASAPAATLSLIPSQSTVPVGQVLQLELRISDLAPGETVGVFDLGVGFDTAKFAFASFSLGSELGAIGLDAWDLGSGLASGSVRLAELSFLDDLSAQPGAFTLATLNFTALNAGPAAFGFTDVTLGDAWGNALAATTVGTSVAISAVPEPASYLLLAAGLVAIGIRRRAAR